MPAKLKAHNYNGGCTTQSPGMYIKSSSTPITTCKQGNKSIVGLRQTAVSMVSTNDIFSIY